MKKVLAKVIHGIVYITYIVLFWLLFPISNIFYGRKRIWLINERGYDARDNGYHFFKYVVSNHPEIKCFYAIDKKSSDYKNIKQFNNILQFGSLKHIFFFTCAKAKISSQMYGYAPNKYYVKYMENHHLQGKNIGLKHGIFKNIHPNYFKERSHLDLIICGAEPEYKFIKDNFGYKDDEVAYCGLARFDNLLNNKPKKQILVMPTFRIPLSGMTKEEFSKTDYFKKWSIFLKNLDERLDDWSNYQAIFYDMVGISDVEILDYSVNVEQNNIHIAGVSQRKIAVYDISGRRIAYIDKSPETFIVTVPATGVYLIQVEGMRARKVVVY